MRSVFVLTVAAALVAANSVAAQTTSAPPATAPIASAPAPSAPATGAPALADDTLLFDIDMFSGYDRFPTPGTPSPGGVTQMPSPSINSTPSQSNVDLYPSTRVLPNPEPSAGTPNPASPGQMPPSGVSQGQAPSGAAQKGGANDRNPVGTNTGDCMKLWSPETPVSKQDWAAACERNQAGLKKAGAVRRSMLKGPGANTGLDAGQKALNRCCPLEETQRVVTHPSARCLVHAKRAPTIHETNRGPDAGGTGLSAAVARLTLKRTLPAMVPLSESGLRTTPERRSLLGKINVSPSPAAKGGTASWSVKPSRQKSSWTPAAIPAPRT